MSNDLYKALQQCLKLLDSGVSAEECLAQYPRHSDELRPLLMAGSEPSGTLQMPHDVKLRVRQRVLLHWDRLHAPKQNWWRPFGWSPRWAAAAVVLVMMLLLGGGVGTAAAAQDSVPGSGLYAVKQLQEEARLWFTRSPEEKVVIYSEYSRERAREVAQLAQSNRQDLTAVSLTRLEDHLTAVDEIWAESGVDSNAPNLPDLTIIEVLDDVLLPRDEEGSVIKALGSDHASDYPCLRHTIQILGEARAQVNASLQTVGKRLPEGSTPTFAQSGSLCPR